MGLCSILAGKLVRISGFWAFTTVTKTIMADKSTRNKPVTVSSAAIYWKTQLNEFLHRPGRLSDLLKILEKKTHQDRLNLVFAACIALFSLLLMGGDVGLMICNIARITYPTYCTINAIETNNAEEKLRWAQFWIVENCLLLVEHYLLTLLTLVVPLYWLMTPVKCNGSSVLYNCLVTKIYHSIVDAATTEDTNIEGMVEKVVPVDTNVEKEVVVPTTTGIGELR